MLRRTKLLVLMVILLLSAALSAVPAIAGAQGKPAAPANGITQVTLGKGATAVAPGRTLLLNRRTFAPGADSGAHPAPGPVVLYVESGYVGFKVIDGEAAVTWGSSAKTEPIVAGSEEKLMPGDEVSSDQGVIHEVRNIGATPAVTIEARLNPAAPAK